MTRPPKKRSPAENGRLSREAWIAAALDALVRDGVERVKVLPLAEALGVTRGSFYWHFANRAELLETLLGLWNEKNTRGIVTEADRGGRSITDSVLNVFELWIDSARFDPKLDFAVREWARRSARVHRIVAAADTERVAALARMYKRAGYAGNEAFIRARILYYMQIGYFALDLRESMPRRMTYIHDYLIGFTGVVPSRKAVSAFCRRALRGDFGE
jgi:AcrR family transcriptional regulator